MSGGDPDHVPDGKGQPDRQNRAGRIAGRNHQTADSGGDEG